MHAPTLIPTPVRDEDKLTLSVGIPAFNEARNIRRLLDAIAKQEQINFKLIETIIVSDGSTDATVDEARASSLENLRVIAHTDRQGQAARQNEILTEFKGDLLMLLNGDVLPGTDKLFAKAVSVFYKDPAVGLVGIKHEPLPARTFVEKVVNFGVKMKADMFVQVNGWDNLYNCRGGARVFSKSFGKKFKWDIKAAEDAYSYTQCKALGFKFSYSDSFIYYRSPSTLKDHIRQSTRFVRSQEILHTTTETTDHLSLVNLAVLGVVLRYFFKNPFLWVAYVLLFVVSRASYWFVNSDPVRYNTSTTSKQVA